MTAFAKRDELGTHAPSLVKDYGDGIKVIRHENGAYSGRALFVEREAKSGVQEYTILTAYKKETPEVPTTVLNRAKQRKNNL